MFCQKCGSQNPDGTQFCTECGTPLVVATAPVQPANPTVNTSAPAPAPKKKKKKGLIIVIVIVAVIALIGIIGSLGGGDDDAADTANTTIADIAETQNDVIETQASATQAPTTQAPKTTATTTTAPVVEGKGTIDDYYVEIVSCKKSKDYDNKDAIIVTYRWTNNSDEATSFMYAMTARAYQDGIECGDAYMVDGVDSQKLLNNVKPGATYEVQDAYLISGSSNEVDIEITGLWDSDVLVSKTFTF